MDVPGLKTRLEQHRQEHLLQFWDDLSAAEQSSLYDDLSSIDLERVCQHFGKATSGLKEAQTKSDDRLEPVPDSLCGSTSRMQHTDQRELFDDGLRLIAEGKVAALLLAGGQGTRLGVSYPKGMYDVQLPSRKTLYQLQAERLLKLQELAFKLTQQRGVIPWYIMTSEHTKEKTVHFFEEHNYFGLSPENVIVFEQHMLPCFTFEGQIILADKHKVARAPDGNGGLYAALGAADIITDMRRRGVTCMHAYCVDNILVKMADPVFMGFCHGRSADCGAKVVEKAFPTEAVGVVCQVDGHYEVVEYSEIALSTAERRREDGRLTFNAGNICNHYFTTDFIDLVTKQHDDELQHHVAKKKIPHVCQDGTVVTPTSPNGIKMEKFVFDVFRFSKSFAVLEVLREDEFAPLKNGPTAAKDTPATCRSALLNQHYRWVLAAGGKFVNDEGTVLPLIPARTSSMPHTGDAVCEISPMASFSGEGLEELCSGKVFSAPIHIVPGRVVTEEELLGASPAKQGKM